MLKALGLSIPAARISDKSDSWQSQLSRDDLRKAVQSARKPSWSSELIAIALFSGIGLLVCLVALLFGQQGYWY
ncbi:hypothetical protein [Bradyrhizobium sp. STM 3562]|uniref:hypothetical protein n=1 Tax=Bradyrhizobium sp. STM 3562 TaxID=578924 RepID=UPI00388F31DB